RCVGLSLRCFSGLGAISIITLGLASTSALEISPACTSPWQFRHTLMHLANSAISSSIFLIFVDGWNFFSFGLTWCISIDLEQRSYPQNTHTAGLLNLIPAPRLSRVSL